MNHDKQEKTFLAFLAVYALLVTAAALAVCAWQMHCVKSAWLAHDAALATALIEQEIPQTAIAAAMSSAEISTAGETLVTALGIHRTDAIGRPYFLSQLWTGSLATVLPLCLLALFLLFAGCLVFLKKRDRLYREAEAVLNRYMENDYSRRLPQNSEGEIYQLFARTEQLATMLQAKSDTERSSREWIKRSISDISHQLKTPLAALAMYQEIMESEPENPDTVRTFSAKSAQAVRRMEALIQSMLKIARLDAGNIHFDKRECLIKDLVGQAISGLATRAQREGKQLSTEGEDALTLCCDSAWTGEAIGNLVKNAIDHTQQGGRILIGWEGVPGVVRIAVSDNGSGIAPEDLFHIFKRFYRSRHSLDTGGTGLGLPLAKAIIEGQGGVLTVQSNPGEGTVFQISFLTKL